MTGSIRLFVKIGLLVFFNLLISEVYGQTRIPDSLIYREWDKSLTEFPTFPRTEGCDSATHHWQTVYYNIDSICHWIATRELKEILGELWCFYKISDLCSPERREINRAKIVEAIKHYKSRSLEIELDVYDNHRLVKVPVTREKWDFSWELIQKYERQGDLQTKLRIMDHLLSESIGFPAVFVVPHIEKERLPLIKLINEIFSTLDRVGEEGYIFGPGHFYSYMGITFYSFKYYEKAIPMLWKAVSQPTAHPFDRSVMRARDFLGTCYTIKGDYDRSDSLYLAILTSREKVHWRPVDNVVAIGSIAANASRRGDKEEAMRLYALSIPGALEVRDTSLAAGYALHLGKLYIETGQPDSTRKLIDLSRKYLSALNLPRSHWKRFYTLSRDYYLKTGHAALAAAYIDSIELTKADEEAAFNMQVLAYAEHELYEAEQIKKEEQLKKVKSRIILVTVILGLCLFTLCIVCYSYRKLQQKNRDLFLRIKAQDAETARHEELLLENDATPVREKLSGNTRQRILFIRLREYLLKDKNFTKADIDVNMLVAELSTNRTYLFDAIKTYTGKTLQEYMNQLRLEEAKRLLETTDEVIESIAFSCGYNSVRTFYRLFKINYNMSPSIYRKMAKEQSKK